MLQKRLTNLQKRRRRENNRRAARRKKIQKYQPLCVSDGFIGYAYHKGWDDVTVDAAALVMHRWFMLRRKFDDDGWVPIPFQVFKEMFGVKYKKFLDDLIESGFLERRGYWAGQHCSRYRICETLRNDKFTDFYYLKSKVLQERFIAHKERWRKMSKEKRKELIGTVVHAVDSAVKKYLTEEQAVTVSRLAENAHALSLNIDEETITEIARKRYDKEMNCDFNVFEQYYQEMAERTLEPSMTVDRWGRFYVPMTSMTREF